MAIPKFPSEKPSRLGPFKPTLILHGGAGSISRANLPPELYARYHASLLKYLTLTRQLLDSGASALDAACHAVTLFEDDPLFNCGRGSVFTEQGTIEMEASVMVCSVDPAGPPAGAIKRAAAVSLVRNTRHPILLARALLATADETAGLGGTSTMHCHLSGREVEEWGWTEKSLEKKSDGWFWTRKRWEEHRRGLHHPAHPDSSYTYDDLLAYAEPLARPPNDDLEDMDIHEIPSQGTVGAVCLDSWGNLAVATSTGGLTNKKAGRIGDTPTIGAGFWAESWTEDSVSHSAPRPSVTDGYQSFELARVMSVNMPFVNDFWAYTKDFVGACLSTFNADPEPRYLRLNDAPPAYTANTPPNTSFTAAGYQPYGTLLGDSLHTYPSTHPMRRIRRHHAVAMSGTGNGDSFLRTDAVRSAASLCRFSPPSSSPASASASETTSLAHAIAAIAGPDGELQRSAGARWGRTGEGQGGIIGIEVSYEVDDDDANEDDEYRYEYRSGNKTLLADGNSKQKNVPATSKQHKKTIKGKQTEQKKRGTPVFDFNCGGLFRAYYETRDDDDGDGEVETPKVMVFKDEY